MPSSGIINVSVRKTSNLKIRRVAGATKRKAPRDRLNLHKETNGEHFMQFIVGTIDIMDQFSEMKGYHLVMDNASIHVRSIIDSLIAIKKKIQNYAQVPINISPNA